MGNFLKGIEYPIMAGIGALLGLFVILVIGTVFGSILLPMVGDAVTMKIMTIVVAPMTEEALKTYFIARGLPWVGTAVVFGLELVQYIGTIVMQGGKLSKALVLRAISLLMHFSTTYIQKKIIDSAVDEDDIKKKMFVAWLTGCAVHMAWNVFAIVYNNELMAWSQK